MTARRLVLFLCTLALLAGCSKSPAVSVSAAANADFPQPDNLQEYLGGELHRALLTCYRDSGSEAVGTTVLKVRGSHGILDVEIEGPSGTAALDACTHDTVLSARLARQIGDTEGMIGFVLSATYAQE